MSARRLRLRSSGSGAKRDPISSPLNNSKAWFDPKASEAEIVNRNYGLAVWFAGRSIGFARSVSRDDDLQIEDVLSFAMEGVLMAARSFDPKRGVRFSTYAVAAMRQKVLKGAMEAHSFGRIALLAANRGAVADLPRVASLSRDVGRGFGNGKRLSLGDALAAQGPDPRLGPETNELLAWLRGEVEHLRGVERDVMESTYLRGERVPAVARRLGLTIPEVNRIAVDALDRIAGEEVFA